MSCYLRNRGWKKLVTCYLLLRTSTVQHDLRSRRRCAWKFFCLARGTHLRIPGTERKPSHVSRSHFRRHKFFIDNWSMSWSSYLNQNIRNALHNPQQLLYLCRRKVWAELGPVLKEPEDTSFIGEDDRRTIWIEIFATGPPQTRHGRPINIDTYSYYVPHI